MLIGVNENVDLKKWVKKLAELHENTFLADAYISVAFCTGFSDFYETAKELLIGTTLKTYQVATSVGYSDPKYFSQVFKHTTGHLPTEYRRLNE